MLPVLFADCDLSPLSSRIRLQLLRCHLVSPHSNIASRDGSVAR